MKIIHSFLLISLLIASFSCTSDNEKVTQEAVIVPEKQLTQMNKGINCLNILSKALYNNIFAKDISQTDYDIKITFTNGEEITLPIGTTDNNIPFIGIEKWKETYCWTLTTGNIKSYLTDEKGNKIPADEHIVPLLKASDGYWTISYDKGLSYQPLLDKNGNHIKVVNDTNNSVSSVKSITTNDNILTLTLIDETELKLSIEDKNSPTLLINGFAKIENSNGLTVNSLFTTEPLTGNGFSIEVLNDSIPQIAYIVDNNDDILMMTRGYFQNKPMEINAETTAQAFLTMILPVFCDNEATFDEVITTIKGCPSYSAVVAEMENLINTQKGIFNPENKALFSSVDRLIDDLFPSTQARGIVIDGIKKQHLDVQAEGTNVTIRNSDLNPPYGCTVSYGDKVIQETLIPSPTSIGLWDVIRSEALNHYSRPINFNLKEEGSYAFFFDKYTLRATSAFLECLFSDILGIVGLKALFNKDITIVEDFIMFGLTEIEALRSGSITPIIAAKDFAGCAADLLLTYGKNMQFKNVGVLLTKAGVFLKNNIVPIIAIYDSGKSTFNISARLAFYRMADPEIRFHLCQYENKVTSCIETSLEIIDGNNQTAISGETLKNPLKVQAKITADDGSNFLSDYYGVKFQVQSGGGYVGNRNVKNVDIDPLTGIASIDWSLGRTGEQLVRAVIYHRITEREVSEPVYFKATLSNKVITGEASDITKNSVSLSGQVIGYDMTGTDKYGVSISTEASMKNATFISAYDHTNGQFTVNISKLTPGKVYYWRAYAKDNNSYVFGDIKYFTTQKEEAPETPTEYLGENFTLELSGIQKVPQTVNTYRICFYIRDLDLKKDAIPYLECTCTPEGYTQYAQTQTTSFKENGEISIMFDNLYAGTNILSFSILVKNSTNSIRQDIGTKNFHVNYKTLKNISIAYMGDEITSSSGNEWIANYKVTYIFENNPLTTTNSPVYKENLYISGLTHYSSSKESTSTDTETYNIRIPEDQYDIDWSNYQAKLKNEKVIFNYYESDLYGNVYGQDIIEKSTEFDYNQSPSIEIIGLNNTTAQSGELADWGAGGFMGSSRGSQKFYWNCTGRLFLRFATFKCEYDLPDGTIEQEETTIAGQKLGEEPIQTTELSMLLYQNKSYNNSLSLKATFPNGKNIESSNTIVIKNAENKIKWSIQP